MVRGSRARGGRFVTPAEAGPPPLPEGQEWVVPAGRPDDRVAVFVVPEDAPPLVREGFARRRVQTLEGECPCGGHQHWPDADPTEGMLGRVVAHHFDDCPAGDAVLIPALLRWRGEQGSNSDAD